MVIAVCPPHSLQWEVWRGEGGLGEGSVVWLEGRRVAIARVAGSLWEGRR